MLLVFIIVSKRERLVNNLQNLPVSDRVRMLRGMPLSVAEKKEIRYVPRSHRVVFYLCLQPHKLTACLVLLFLTLAVHLIHTVYWIFNTAYKCNELQSLISLEYLQSLYLLVCKYSFTPCNWKWSFVVFFCIQEFSNAEGKTDTFQQEAFLLQSTQILHHHCKLSFVFLFLWFWIP